MQYGWSLDKTDWDTLIQLADGLNWYSCEFTRTQDIRVPERPGVYLVCAPPVIKITKLGFNVLYSGSSKTSIRTRFKRHLNSPTPTMQKAMECFGHNQFRIHFLYAETTAEKAMSIEAKLIDCFGGRVNKIKGFQASLLPPVSVG